MVNNLWIIFKWFYCLCMTPIMLLITIFTLSTRTWQKFLDNVWKDYGRSN